MYLASLTHHFVILRAIFSNVNLFFSKLIFSGGKIQEYHQI